MKDEKQVWLNGKFIPWSSATVPILSHAFSRASAIFEIFRIHTGPEGPAAFRMDAHLERLLNSAGFLEMEMCYSVDTIAEAVAETVICNNVGRGVVKIMAYWGEEAVIRLLPQSKPDLVIFAIPEMPEMNLDSREPVKTCISKWRKLDPETVPVSAKACSNYLNAYLAKKDAVARGFDIGIMLGTDGFVTEGSAESVFIVKDGIVKIPPLGRVLPGISRMSVLEMAGSMGLTTAEEPLSLNDLYSADEIFLSHTGVKVEPVKQLEDKDLVAPGPVTCRLMEQMAKILAFEDALYMKWMQKLSV
ncbi:MAG: aminotransferase class IV [Desulfobacterales bacterium]|nr:aminotransferase class IV [Desulfobacterales bacterium]MDX2511262.1 aminotransferase class IV [Desulfobacterales bacterium]